MVEGEPQYVVTQHVVTTRAEVSKQRRPVTRVKVFSYALQPKQVQRHETWRT